MICDNCGKYNNNFNDICNSCVAIELGEHLEYNEDEWIDSALHAYVEEDGYGEWDAWQAQYDVADMDIYY